MSFEWYRHWHGTVSDPKFIIIGKKSNSRRCEVLSVWECLLEHASSVTTCNANVTRGNLSGFDFDDCDALLELESGQSRRIYDALVEKGIIADNAITNWERRQPKKEDNSSERVKIHRLNKRIKELEEKLNSYDDDNIDAEPPNNITPCNDGVTPCNDVSQNVTLDKIRSDKIREDKDLDLNPDLDLNTPTDLNAVDNFSTKKISQTKEEGVCDENFKLPSWEELASWVLSHHARGCRKRYGVDDPELQRPIITRLKQLSDEEGYSRNDALLICLGVSDWAAWKISLKPDWNTSPGVVFGSQFPVARAELSEEYKFIPPPANIRRR